MLEEDDVLTVELLDEEVDLVEEELDLVDDELLLDLTDADEVVEALVEDEVVFVEDEAEDELDARRAPYTAEL